MSEIDTMIPIAISDAAKNCATTSDAVATITLRSGVQLRGKLDSDFTNVGLGTTGHLKHGSGWTTFLLEEVAAVSVDRQSRGF